MAEGEQPEHREAQPVFSEAALAGLNPECRAALVSFAASLTYAQGFLEKYVATKDARIGLSETDAMAAMQRDARLVLTMSWSKAVLYSRGVIDGVNSGNLLSAFLALRGYVEMMAILRFAVTELRPTIERCATRGYVTSEDLGRIMNQFNLLLHGGRAKEKT